MTAYETLKISVDHRRVATLELNLREKRNALSATMIEELTQFAQEAASQPNLRALILCGAGDIFCAGGDLAWMKAQIHSDRATRIKEARKLANLLQLLNELPMPLIGKIHGGAFGGGVGMICVCDIVIAAENTKFGLTETKLGLIPATIGPYVVARLGEAMARRVFMSGRIFDAQEALRLGLVAQICPQNQLDHCIQTQVEPYLTAAPLAVHAAKNYVRELGNTISKDIIEDSVQKLADIWEGAEALEGIDAFLSKRKPEWAQTSNPLHQASERSEI